MAKCRNKRSVPAKAHLASKICPVCQKPFSWRKKWERVWDDVKYCSERCRRSRATD
ncbi:MAG: DUF2256 domain-containing protein [Pseudomonadota bacterium]